MSSEVVKPIDIITFWFSPPANEYWFKATNEFDSEVRAKFKTAWEQASNNKLNDWKSSAEGTLALIITLDQFPLNMFRGEPKSFSTEHMAIELTYFAISNKMDKTLPKNQLSFLYIPLMHSENIKDQNLSVKLFKNAGLDKNLRFAKHHREIILKFKRFPHRNIILKRISTKEEIRYLNSSKAFKG